MKLPDENHLKDLQKNRIAKKLAAEFAGTFSLVFAGTGAIIINDLSGGRITHLGVATTFGLIVLILIYTLGDISGAHLNPAVTFGFYLARQFKGRNVLPYISSQFMGATAASLCLKLIFTQHQTLGATEPSGSLMQSFITEIILSWILMFVILSVSTRAKEEGVSAGIAVGYHRAGSTLCGSDIRRFNESGSLVGPGTRIRASRKCLDLPVSALNWRRSGGPSVSCYKSRRLLPNGAKREHL